MLGGMGGQRFTNSKFNPSIHAHSSCLLLSGVKKILTHPQIEIDSLQSSLWAVS